MTFEKVEPVWTACYTATGPDAAEEARNYFLKWISSEGLFNDNRPHRIFAYYNHEKIGRKDFFFKIHITVDRKFSTQDKAYSWKNLREDITL